MILDKELLFRLAEELPALQIVAEQDSRWPLEADPQAYLSYCHINFAQEIPRVVHGFGRVNSGGFRVATHYWLSPECKGSVLIVHGHYDHVGVYRHPFELALHQGYAVLAFDLPCHGLSSGMVASIDSFGLYADVLSD